MKSEHVLKIRFSPPGSAMWIFTVPAVVDRCLLDTCGAHGPRLIGCVPQFPEIIEKHCFQHLLLNNLMCAVLKRLDQEYAHGWNPDAGLDFSMKRKQQSRKPKSTPADTDQNIRRAELFARSAHHAAGNKRRYTDEPYITHPAAIVELLKTVPHTPEMLQAAWLHDVLEDTKTTAKQIREIFGDKVLAMVWQLTDRMALADGNRKLRKAVERLRYSYVSNEAKTIKLADLIDNAKSIIQHDPDFAKVYIKEMRDLLTCLREGDSSLWIKAMNFCDAYDRGVYTKPEPKNAEVRRPLFSCEPVSQHNDTLRSFSEFAVFEKSLFDGIKPGVFRHADGSTVTISKDDAEPKKEPSKQIWSAQLLELLPGKDSGGVETAKIKVRISPIEVALGLPSDKQRLFLISNFSGEFHSAEMVENLSNAISTATEFWLDKGKRLYLDKLDFDGDYELIDLPDNSHIVKLEYRIVHK